MFSSISLVSVGFLICPMFLSRFFFKSCFLVNPDNQASTIPNEKRIAISKKLSGIFGCANLQTNGDDGLILNGILVSNQELGITPQKLAEQANESDEEAKSTKETKETISKAYILAQFRNGLVPSDLKDMLTRLVETESYSTDFVLQMMETTKKADWAKLEVVEAVCEAGLNEYLAIDIEDIVNTLSSDTYKKDALLLFFRVIPVCIKKHLPVFIKKMHGNYQLDVIMSIYTKDGNSSQDIARLWKVIQGSSYKMDFLKWLTIENDTLDASDFHGQWSAVESYWTECKQLLKNKFQAVSADLLLQAFYTQNDIAELYTQYSTNLVIKDLYETKRTELKIKELRISQMTPEEKRQWQRQKLVEFLVQEKIK